ncbi:MAG: hypothetical protein RR406_05570 [Bacilli bacterium]
MEQNFRQSIKQGVKTLVSNDDIFTNEVQMVIDLVKEWQEPYADIYHNNDLRKRMTILAKECVKQGISLHHDKLYRGMTIYHKSNLNNEYKLKDLDICSWTYRLTVAQSFAKGNMNEGSGAYVFCKTLKENEKVFSLDELIDVIETKYSYSPYYQKIQNENLNSEAEIIMPFVISECEYDCIDYWD